MKTETFNVPSISCGHCVAAITDEVSGVAGVKNVNVDLGTKLVRVEAEENVARETLTAAIKEAGYDVSPFDSTISLS